MCFVNLKWFVLTLTHSLWPDGTQCTIWLSECDGPLQGTSPSLVNESQQVLSQDTMNKRSEHPEPLQWMHASEGAMHSREAAIPSDVIAAHHTICGGFPRART